MIRHWDIEFRNCRRGLTGCNFIAFLHCVMDAADDLAALHEIAICYVMRVLMGI